MNSITNSPHPLECYTYSLLGYNLVSTPYHISGNVSKPSLTLSPCASLRLQVQGSPELFHWMRHYVIVRCKKRQYVTGRSDLSFLVQTSLCPCWFKNFLLSLPQMTNNQKWHLYHFTYLCSCIFLCFCSSHFITFDSVNSFVDWANESNLNEGKTNAVLSNLPCLCLW